MRFATIALLLVVSQDVPAGQVPRMKALGANGEPIWISADSIALPNGDLNLSALNKYDARTLGGYLKVTPEADCIQIDAIFHDAPNVVAPDTLDETISRAGFIVEATVRELQPGFYEGVPGNLLDLQVTKTYHDVEASPRPAHLYLFFPVGDFKAGKYHFCKVDPGFPPLPGVGDHVYFFGVPPLGRDRDILHVVHPGQVAVVPKASDHVVLAGALSDNWSGHSTTEVELRSRISRIANAIN